MRVHPFAEMMPAMAPSEVDALADDIRENGLREPIWLFEEKILDGRHRWKACEKAGVEPKTRVFQGTEQQALDLMLSENVRRRHLSEPQREMIAARLATLKHGGVRRSNKMPNGTLKVAEAAKLLNVSERNTKRARVVLDSGDAKLIAACERGEMRVSKAASEAKRREREAKALLKVQDKPTQTPKGSTGMFSIAEWKRLPDAQRAEILATPKGSQTFNKQDNESIDWAKWSWNPVTGCRHSCPYCYARDIAMRYYTQKFEPTFLPDRLGAPGQVKVPAEAKSDISYRNVFTCSMADLFGRWVPAEWIQAVLDTATKHDQWNYLFLTKFPKRYEEFQFPKNAWVGTTVDCQARVKSAEEAFSNITASVKWLSIEPMLEPLQFERLDLFQWIVIGGASHSSKTPDWRVPAEWWGPLHAQATELGIPVYHKSNLYGRAKGFPGVKARTVLPKSFVYLSGKSKSDIVLGEAG